MKLKQNQFLIFAAVIFICLTTVDMKPVSLEQEVPRLQPPRSPTQQENALKSLPPELRGMFIVNSEKFGIDLDILVSIATWESGLNPRVVSYNKNSNTYDRGLFQINSRYEEEFIWRYWDRTEKFDHFNPEHSLYMACRILSTYRSFLGSEESAIRSYNTGLWGFHKTPEKSDFYFRNVVRIQSKFIPKS